MDLDQQIKTLIDQAPQDGDTPQIVEAIAPALKLLAQQLKLEQYYILQTLDQSWVLTTLSNLNQPELEKRVIYAYPTLKDATTQTQSPLNANLVAIPLPVTHILFQMIALETLDSIVFFEHSGNFDAGTEVKQDDVQQLIRSYLQQYQARQRSKRKTPKIPPNLA